MRSNILRNCVFVMLLLVVQSGLAAEPVNFSGKWQTAWGPVTLKQAKSKVTGTYTGSFSGKIEGTVTGRRLNFKWMQTNKEWGGGYFDMSPDGQSFTGKWGGYDSNSNGGAWNGNRM